MFPDEINTYNTVTVRMVLGYHVPIRISTQENGYYFLTYVLIYLLISWSRALLE